MKKFLLKLRNKWWKSFVYCFALLALVAARSSYHRCIIFFGNAKKTPDVTPDAIQSLLDEKLCNNK